MKYSFDDLKGRVCVITGGFGVIGTALTRGLAEAGVNLAVISRSASNPEKGEAIAKEFRDAVQHLDSINTEETLKKPLRELTTTLFGRKK